MNALLDWLNTEIEHHNWSMRETSRRAGLSETVVSNVIAGRANPGFDFCVGVARAFDVPPEMVLRLAGLLPPPAGYHPKLDEMSRDFAELPPEEQDEVVQIVRLKLAKLRRQKQGRK